MTPAQTLVIEHGPIVRGIAALEAAASRAVAGDRPEKELWLDLIRFLRGFADKLHHQKEEALFLPAARAVAAGEYREYVDEVLAEHVTGRGLVRSIEEAVHSYYAGNEDQLSAITGAVQAYSRLLGAHIRK